MLTASHGKDGVFTEGPAGWPWPQEGGGTQGDSEALAFCP